MTHRLSPAVSARGLLLVPLLLLGVAGCDGYNEVTDPILGEAPRALDARYQWVQESWVSGEPRGYPTVEVTWELPSGWSGESFRVYSRRSGSASFLRIATVTSCGQGVCRYTDLNVAHGESYDYYVAAVDERSGREVESPTRVQVRVPVYTVPAAPAAPAITALDGALFLRWASTGAQRYRILLQSQDGQSHFDVGETDGTSFLDDRAQNGIVHRYQVVAIDTLGHFSRLGAAGSGVPRPDYHAELIYPLELAAAESGFRFVASPASESPIVSGDSPSAHWRLETVNGVLSIRPVGSTRVTQGTFTTALTCGAGSEPDCESVEVAPASSAFGSAPVAVEAAHTYVFRVVGSDGQTRYGKVRVQGRTTDRDGRTVLVFDWAYQLRPDEPRLTRMGD